MPVCLISSSPLCFSAQETTRLSVAATIFFCFCSAAAMAPQYLKIYIRRACMRVAETSRGAHRVLTGSTFAASSTT